LKASAQPGLSLLPPPALGERGHRRLARRRGPELCVGVNERFDSLFFVEFLKHRVSVAQVREHFICLLTAAAMTWDDFPNLRRRPPTPSKGRGPVQVRIRRAFIARVESL
jgi:hypothetical protein